VEAAEVALFEGLAPRKIALGVLWRRRPSGAAVKFLATEGAGDPGLAACVVVKMRGDFLKLWDDLQAGGAVADDGDALPRRIERLVPERSMS